MTNHLFFTIRARLTDLARPFIVTADERRITFGDMLVQTGRIANVLAETGVKPGDRVAVQVEKSTDALMLYLACVRAGAVYLPLNTAYTLAELEYFIGDAEPALVVAAPARREAIAALAGKIGARTETLG